MDNTDSEKKNIEIALRQYIKNKERVIKYNKEHPEKCRVRQKKNYDKIKLEEPEKYKAMLERKRLNYQAKNLTQKTKK
jgi:hypothetical protein